MPIGIGYDVHPLADGRKLVLGGVDIPFDKGLEGHSDGDVLVHAVIDALLGAAGKGDIGTHFPSTESQYKGASSLHLLTRVRWEQLGPEWQIGNVDATIVAQEPRLAPFANRMKSLLARALEVAEGKVNVKATSTDGLGFAGTGEGIAAYAIALIEESA